MFTSSQQLILPSPRGGDGLDEILSINHTWTSDQYCSMFKLLGYILLVIHHVDRFMEL